MPNAFSGLDHRKWFDRMLPQTLQIATWLLYIDGAFAVLGYLDKTDMYGEWRWYGGTGSLIAFLACLSFFAGGFLMANGRRIGWWVSLGASLAPFILRLLLKMWHDHARTLTWVVTQNNLITFVFEAALVALVVHPMSRAYANRWLR